MTVSTLAIASVDTVGDNTINRLKFIYYTHHDII